MDSGNRRTAGDPGCLRRSEAVGCARHASALPLGGRQQDVQDAVRLQLHLRLLHAGLREPAALLALHPGLQDLPRLYDSALPDPILPGCLASANGHVAGPQRGPLLHGRRLLEPQRCGGRDQDDNEEL